MGGTFGGSCSGRVDTQAGVGWAFCNDGQWAYTTSDPGADGFTTVRIEADGGMCVPQGAIIYTGGQGQGQGQGQDPNPLLRCAPATDDAGPQDAGVQG
jgi:hypothetical protein